MTYEWDANSNRTKVSDNAIKQAVVSGAASGTLSSTYDNAGRMTKDGCNSYTYDAFDRVEKQVLTSIASNPALCGEKSRTTTYSYDGLDRQRSTTVSGAGDANGTMRGIYDGLSTTVVGQLDAVNGALNKPDVLYQLDAAGTAVAFEQTGAGATKSFLDTDGKGNVTAVVSTAQTVDCGARFDPFGKPVDPQVGTDSNGVCHTGGAATTTGNSYWYRGQTRDASTGNYQLGTRTYDPTKAAFTTPDAYRVSSPSTDLGVGTDPLTANTYTYVNGNPLNFGDSDGHRAVDTRGNDVSPCVSNPSSCSAKGAREERQAYTQLLSSQRRAEWVDSLHFTGIGKASVKGGVTSGLESAAGVLSTGLQWAGDWINHNGDALLDSLEGALEIVGAVAFTFLAVDVAAACAAGGVLTSPSGVGAVAGAACVGAAVGSLVVADGFAADGYDKLSDGISNMEGVPRPGNGGLRSPKGKSQGSSRSTKSTESGRSTGGGRGSSTTSGGSSSSVGAEREQAVAELTGGRVSGEPGKPGMKITQPNVGSTDVDVFGPNGEYIAVGGPAKARKRADLGRRLSILRYAATEAGVPG